MEKVLMTVLPLAFLAHLGVSELLLARRHIDLGGRPPIDRRLFFTCKYLVIVIWVIAALQSWGVGFAALTGGPALRWVSMALWMLGFAVLILGRVALSGHLRFGLPDERTALRRTGVYGLCRNPMYVGLDTTMVAAILYTLNPAVLAAGAFAIAAHHGIILAEERWLRHAFGRDYESYRAEVGRYFTAGKWTLRIRSLARLVRMGHCAPTVMRTILGLQGRPEQWLVRLVAGLPGGIGNTGGECGGITAPLVLLGLRHGLAQGGHGVPVVVERGRDHLRRFHGRCGTLMCRDIRGTPPRVLPCMHAVACSPEIYAAALDGVPGEAPQAHARLCAAFAASGFHCAHAVLQALRPLPAPRRELLAAASAFVGGTVLEGLTCGALVAGVMAVGLRLAEIENNPLRVLHMVILMLTGGPAFDDRINRFNPTMNLGGELAGWFASELGSTQCREITRADFSSDDGVQAYLDSGGIERCRSIAAKVAGRVLAVLSARPAT